MGNQTKTLGTGPALERPDAGGGSFAAAAWAGKTDRPAWLKLLAASRTFASCVR